MKKFFFLIILIVVVALGWFSNPSIEQHRAKVIDVARIAVTSSLEEEVKAYNGGILGSLLAAFVGDKVVEKGIEAMVANKMEYHDYLLASTATIDGNIVSVGAFGKVFTANAETLKGKMKGAMKEGVKKIVEELK